MNPRPIEVVFESYHPTIPGWSAAFAYPSQTLIAERLADVVPLLNDAWQASLQGQWVALMLSYEAAPAFDPAFTTHPLTDFPLAWAALFDGQTGDRPHSPSDAYTVGRWQPLVSEDQYQRSVKAIKDLIAQGQTYQVNYTIPFTAAFSGDAFAWYQDLTRAQQAPFSAYVNMGRYSILSLSPELFFKTKGRTVESQPMKGTLPRGRWMEEDDQRTVELANCPKNRAENVMIVDLVRNDLGRIARPGSVKPLRMFEVQRFRSVLQMISTIRATMNPQTTLTNIFQALFPGGSITGAPKIRTMDIIRRFEPSPRGVYTGALGFLAPGGDAVFNLPIRTVVVDTLKDQAEFHVGGGITTDSLSLAELEECRVKMHFVANAPANFELLESLRLSNGRYYLLTRHVNRLLASAQYFGLPVRKNALLLALAKIRKRHPQGLFKVRLLANEQGHIHAEATSITLHPRHILRIGLAKTSVSSQEVFLFHKTTRREWYGRALAEQPDCEDVLLFNEKGELTESTRANLVLDLNGRLVTPPVSSGLLAGTLRDKLLTAGTIQEQVLFSDDLHRAKHVWLINSIRGWMKAKDVPL